MKARELLEDVLAAVIAIPLICGLLVSGAVFIVVGFICSLVERARGI